MYYSYNPIAATAFCPPFWLISLEVRVQFGSKLLVGTTMRWLIRNTLKIRGTERFCVVMILINGELQFMPFHVLISNALIFIFDNLLTSLTNLLWLTDLFL